MLSRQQKRSNKKTTSKTNLKLKTHITIKHQTQIDIFPLFKTNQTILQKKYIYRQLRTQFSDNIKKIDKNKAMTQLRLYCSQKQYMLKLYSNPIAILKLRSNSESRLITKGNLGGHIVAQTKIDKIIQHYSKSKINLFTKLNKIQYCVRNQKTQTKILSTGYDDSDFCLKTLVSKIENMIPNITNFGQTSNILQQDNQMPFDGSKIKISQISHQKVQFQPSTQLKNIRQEKRQQKKMIQNENKDTKYLSKFGSTQPVISLKPKVVNQYGIVRYPQQQNKLKSRKAFKKKKNQDNSNSTKKQSNSLSSNKSKKASSVSSGKKVKNLQKVIKRKQQAYNQKKLKTKEINKIKSNQK